MLKKKQKIIKSKWKTDENSNQNFWFIKYNIEAIVIFDDNNTLVKLNKSGKSCSIIILMKNLQVKKEERERDVACLVWRQPLILYQDNFLFEVNIKLKMKCLSPLK